MKKIIAGYLKGLENKTFDTGKLLDYIQIKHVSKYEEEGSYSGFYLAVRSLAREGYIKPVKSSGRFFMTPPLFNRYRKTVLLEDEIISKKEIETLKRELMCMNPKMDKHYYLARPDKFLDDRERANQLNDWLNSQDSKGEPLCRNTVNERSFEIFNNEKYLAGKGIKMLSNLGLTLEALNCYKTYEAFFYILFDSRKRGNVLIIENKDSFMSLLYHLQKQNRPCIHNTSISMLVYGEGKKIIKSFSFMDELKRQIKTDKIYYWGDLDYAGIEILLKLIGSYGNYNIIPMVNLYGDMLECANNPPRVKSKQNRVPIDAFLKFFESDISDRIKDIIYNGKYIPQEAVRFG